jgi:5-methyltetrahydropteroyltriglutamate--homocysteine methyltransferase
MPEVLRADHVGSLLRPASLLQARAAAAQGSLSAEALRDQEDAAILQALDRQRQVGLEIFTDGEFRRGSWITDVAEAVDGFVPQSRVMVWKGPGGGAQASTSNVVGARLQPRRRITAHESGFLRHNAPGRVKMTLPAPSNFFVASWKPGLSDAAYASREEMAHDIARIIRAEVEALINEDIDYIQLDAPFYGSFIDADERQRLQDSGLDPDTGIRIAVEADTAAVAAGNLLSEDDQWRKLELVVRTARGVWST